LIFQNLHYILLLEQKIKGAFIMNKGKSISASYNDKQSTEERMKIIELFIFLAAFAAVLTLEFFSWLKSFWRK